VIVARNPSKKWLVFIDTNILLDFYRLPGESALRQLKALEKHRGSLILGDQLRMEFLKNRQAAIVAGIQAMQKPLRPTVPSVLLDAQAAKTLIKNYTATEKKWQQVKKRIENMLTNPSTADPVYQHLTRIFDHDGDFNLKRPNKVRFTIRNLARKRFSLGYPPRKQNATSLGDSINWEWIIHCAANSEDHHNILIVSRDSDYGITYDGKTTLNDWLYREFKERVSKKRQVELTQKLTDALKRLNEQVTAGDLAEEERLLIGQVRALTLADFESLIKKFEEGAQKAEVAGHHGDPTAS
jgi:hypothetical protein